MKYNALLFAGAILLSIHSQLFATSLPVGTVASGNLSLPGQQDRFTFSGSVGQRIFYDALDLDNESMNARLIAPSGTTVYENNQSSDVEPIYLPENGTYTLLIDGNLDTVGDYQFRLLDLASATNIVYGATNSGALNPQSQTAMYRFTGTNGQRVTLTNLSASASGANMRLIAPDDEVLLVGNITSTLGETVLPMNGTYVVLVEGFAEDVTPLNYQFKVVLISNPTGTASNPFGTIRLGTTTANQTNSFLYTAPAGTVIYFDSLTNTATAFAQLLDPNGNQVFYIYSNGDSGPYRLPRSGTYTLKMIGYDNGPYRCRLLNCDIGGGSGVTDVVLTNTMTTTLNPAFATQVYRITNAVVGQKLYYDALDGDFDAVQMRLYGPTLGYYGWSYANADYDQLFTINEPGVYYLVAENQTAYATNDVSFRLLDTAQLPTTNLVFDTLYSGRLSPGLRSDIYSFGGTAGQRVFVDMASTNNDLGAYYYVYGPNNQALSWNYLHQDTEILLSQTGTNLLVIFSPFTTNLSYKFSVSVATSVTNPLTLGATVSGNLTKAGEQHRFTFSGTAGQRLYYDALDADYDAVNVWIEDSLGNIIYLNQNSDSDSAPFTLLRTDNYTLVQKQLTPVAGDYKFRLLDLNQSPVANVSFDTTVNGVLNPASRQDIYRFSGIAGQRLYFDAMPTNGAGAWYLFGPMDNQLGGNGLTGDFETTLPQTGTYSLLIGYNGSADSATNVSGYSFRIVTPSTITAPLTLDTTISNVLSKAGDEHHFTFAGTIGQRLFYDALEADYDSVAVYLLSPSGSIVHINGNSDSDVGPFTLTENGTYTLVQKANNDTAPLNYQFRLLDVNAATTISYGATVTGQIIPQIATKLYRFTGTAGDRVNLESLATSSPNANWYLFTPANSAILSGGIVSNLGEIVLPYSGTYVMAIEGSADNPFELDFQIRVSLVSSSSGTTAGFGTVYSGTIAADQTNSYSFTAPAGLPVYLDTYTNSFSAFFQLLDQSGNQVFYQWSYSDGGPYFLPTSGTYTLNVINYSGGDYSFRLLDLNQATNLVIAQKYETTMTPYRTDVFKFTGTNGQRLYYDALLPVSYYTYPIALLYAPSGGVVSLNQSSSYDSVPFTLNESGTFYLMLNNDATGTDYSFRLLDAAQAPSQTVTFDTTIGGDLFAVPSSWLSVTGSYVNVNLRSYAPNDDWRTTQTISGTRAETSINYVTTNWGTLASVGLAAGANGTDDNWDNYSVQFDGTVTITNPNTRLYLQTDNGGRMWIDVNHNGIFEDTGSESINNSWGTGSPGLSYGSFPLTNGTYAIRIQFEEDSGDNNCILLADTGKSLGSEEAQIYRFTGTKGQRLFFDSLIPFTGYNATWTLVDPNNSQVGANYVGFDFESILPVDGTYLLTFASIVTNPVPLAFRIVTPASTTNALNFETIYSGAISEPGEEIYYTFNATAGQRIYYDGLDGEPSYVTVRLTDPMGTIIYGESSAASDYGPFTLTRSGTYSLRVKGSGDYTRNYRFRLLDVANAPTVALDTIITNNITLPFGAVLYNLPVTPNLRLLVDHLAPPTYEGYYWVYNGNDQNMTYSWLGSDVEFTPTQTNGYMMVLTSGVSNNVPYSFQVVPNNHAPVLAVIGNRTVNEQAAISFTATATDLESPDDQLTYSLDAGSPSGATINPSSGAFTWTPTEAQGPGVYSVTVRVTDDGTPNLNDFETFTITVNEINLPPVLTVPGNQTISELTALSVNASATDPDIPTNTLTFSLANPPAGMSINATSGAISWIPSEAQGPSTNTIQVVVTDNNPIAVNAQQLSVTNSFVVTVNEVNVAPTLGSITNRTINELTTLSVTNAAGDVDLPANGLSYVLLTAPAGASIDSSGVITWTPTEAQGPSTNTFTTRVTDNNPQAINTQQLSATNTFTVTVNEINVAPVLTVPTTQTINELTTLSISASATDADVPTNTLTFSLNSPPTGMSINPATGAISWTPSEAQGPSTNTIQVVVTDNNPSALSAQQLSTTNSFVVIVNEVNLAPTLGSITNRTINELTTLTLTNAASDADVPANALSYALLGAPAGASIDTNGVITWTPTEAQGPSTNTFTTRVTDNSPQAVNAQQLSATNSFTVVVNEVNAAPSLNAITNQIVDELTTLTVTNTASDSDLPPNNLTYALVSGPAGAVINSTNGVLTWIPTEAQGPSTNTISISVTDDGSPNLSVTNSFVVTVNEVNSAPSLSLPSNLAIPELQAYSAAAVATDSDIPTNTLTYALVSGPAGVNVASNGAITWTPSEAQGPGSYTITVKATDNGSPSLSTTNSYSLTVNEVNSNPVLAAIGNRTINAGQILSITNSATDSDLPTNTLSFILGSAPTGVNLSSGGILTWRPTIAQANTTNSISVQTSDGVGGLDAKTFTVVVSPLSPVTLTPVSLTSNQFEMSVSGTVGPDYVIQASSDLTTWSALSTNSPISVPFNYIDNSVGATNARVYRVLLKP